MKQWLTLYLCLWSFATAMCLWSERGMGPISIIDLNLDKGSPSSKNDWGWLVCAGTSSYISEVHTEMDNSFQALSAIANISFSQIQCKKPCANLEDANNCAKESDEGFNRRPVIISLFGQRNSTEAEFKPLQEVTSSIKSHSHYCVFNHPNIETWAIHESKSMSTEIILQCLGRQRDTDYYKNFERNQQLVSKGHVFARDKYWLQATFGLNQIEENKQKKVLKKQLEEICFGKFESILTLDNQKLLIQKGEIFWVVDEKFNIVGYQSIYNVINWIELDVISGRIINFVQKNTTYVLKDHELYSVDEVQECVRTEDVWDKYSVDAPYDAIMEFDGNTILFQGHSFYVISGERGMSEEYPKKSRLWSESINFPISAAVTLNNSSLILYFKGPYVWIINSAHILTVETKLAFDFFRNCDKISMLN